MSKMTKIWESLTWAKGEAQDSMLALDQLANKHRKFGQPVAYFLENQVLFMDNRHGEVSRAAAKVFDLSKKAPFHENVRDVRHAMATISPHTEDDASEMLRRQFEAVNKFEIQLRDVLTSQHATYKACEHLLRYCQHVLAARETIDTMEGES